MIDRNFYSVIEVFLARMRDMRISSRKLSKKIKINPGWMSRLLTGKAPIKRKLFLRLCDELDLSPAELEAEFPNDFNPLDGSLRAIGEPPVYIHSRDRK